MALLSSIIAAVDTIFGREHTSYGQWTYFGVENAHFHHIMPTANYFVATIRILRFGLLLLICSNSSDEDIESLEFRVIQVELHFGFIPMNTF